MDFSLSKRCSKRCPTALGWGVLLLLLAAVAVALLAGLYPFLAPDAPPRRGIMVVEGWIGDEALAAAVAAYRAGDYSRIACTGVPIETGSYLLPFHSYSEMTADRLRALGVADDEMIVATGKLARKDRTYLSALALRDALRERNIAETDIHLVTEGPHGRRSRLLFKKALGKRYRVGITCLPDPGYDPAHWYAYSQGVRKVIGELIAYAYAKFLFHPGFQGLEVAKPEHFGSNEPSIQTNRSTR